MTKPLLFGASGQVGAALLSSGCFLALSRRDADLSDPRSCRAAILTRRPPVVVNAAAYTAVDRAEAEANLAFTVNRDAPAALAEACAELDIPLIHLSTDYVFDGALDRPYRETDTPRPLSVYGASKLAGEEEIRKRLVRHVILRTAWVFSDRRDNFVRTMVRLANHQEIKVVDDQIGGPTAATAVASAVLAVLDAISDGRGVWGTFHYCGAPAVSRFGLASAVFFALGRGPKVLPVGTPTFPLPARRPAQTMLDCSSLRAAYGIVQPDWRPTIPETVQTLMGAS